MQILKKYACFCAIVAICMACGDNTTALVCTDIGCDSGLMVEVAGLQADSAEIAVQVLDAPPWVIGCDRDHCTAGVFFPHFTPDYVEITVRIGDREVVEDVRPEYRVLQPNGPECEPTCHMATVEIAVGTQGI